MEVNKVKRKTLFKAIYLLCILTTVVVVLSFIPVRQYTISALEYIEGLGSVGYLLFVLLYIAFTVLFLPGSIPTLGGGVIFGVFKGFLLVSLGSTIGAAIAFLLGRFFARSLIERKIKNNQKFAAIDNAVGTNGWKIVFLTRLSPIFPFNLLNYAYGLTKVSFKEYILASWIGMMPGTLLYVYIGSLVGDIARVAVGESPDIGALGVVFQILGLVATLVVTIYITRIAKKALQEQVSL
jgi:uncharacterized membrane protein YdjX (TVP38/TMEM64 family)